MGLLSAIAGWARRAPRVAPPCPDGSATADRGFSAAVTALGAKLAKADGAAEPTEYVAFTEVFAPGPEAERDVRRLYDLARQTTRGFESYARQLARRYRDCPQVLERVIAGLFVIARADGAATDHEISYIERVADLFGVQPLVLRRIRAEQLGLSVDDPYRVLDVPPDASDAAVKDAWRRALLVFHPDKAGGGAAPLHDAENRSAELNAAYDRVMRERRELLAAGRT